MLIYPERKIQGCTYFDEFQYHGKSYYLNTIVDLKHKRGIKDIQLIQVVEAGLYNSGDPFWTYAFWVRNGHVVYIESSSPIDEEVLQIISPSEHPPQIQKPEYYKDAEVPDVYVGWCIYFCIMFFGIIFKDVACLWVFATVCFIQWRRNKLRKPMIHDYGFNVKEKVGE